MLKSIIQYEISSKIVIFEDNVKVCSDDIFNVAVRKTLLFSTKNNVNVICIDKGPNSYKNEHCTSANFINPFTTKSRASMKIPQLPSLFEIKDNDVILIDSVSPFLWRTSFSQFAEDLATLAKTAQRILIRVHSDTLLMPDHVKLLEHSCTTHVRFIEQNEDGFLLQVTHKKPGGKILTKRQLEVCQVDENGEVSSRVFVKKAAVVAPRVVPMESLTTFDLGVSLNRSERHARERLILPYLRTSEEETGARIDYEADDADLEEDPDEDLEL